MQTREQRRSCAVKRRKVRQEEEARKFALLSDSQKQRHVRRFRRSKARPLPLEMIASFKVKPVREHTGRLKVLFLSASDYAFLGYSLAKSLKSIDIEAKAISGRYSPLRPQSEQGRMCSREELLRLAQETYAVVWMHSLYTALPIQVLKGKKCVVFHGGTRYRRSSTRINNQFNDIVHLCLVQTGELLNRGAKNERWLLPPVDTKLIKPQYSFENKKKLIIGHFSSHLGNRNSKSHIKGSVLIESVIDQLKKSKWKDHFVFKKSTGRRLIPWKENIKRMAECDIYIESLSHAEPKNRNKHDWSIQALEACSLGCITISNFLFEERYKKVYGNHGLVVANNGDTLLKILVSLFQKDRKELLELKQKARYWVENKHSFEAVGKRLEKLLEL